MSRMLELSDGSRVPLDEHGHLNRREDWNREVAKALATADGLELGAGHWLAMDVLTAHYEAYGVETPMRLLVRKLRERGAPELASSRALYRLFPEGPVRQGSRYAGLPIPVSCI